MDTDESLPIDLPDQPKEHPPGTLRMEAPLPSGKVVVMREITGKEELLASSEAGDVSTEQGRTLAAWGQAFRACVSIDGTPLAHHEHTPESFRDLFSAKDFMLVTELFMMLNRPTIKETETFRAAARIST